MHPRFSAMPMRPISAQRCYLPLALHASRVAEFASSSRPSLPASGRVSRHARRLRSKRV